MKYFPFTLWLLCLCTFVIPSCLKKEYDIPPDLSGYDPMLPVTHNIAQLKAMNGAYDPVYGGDNTMITDEIIIAGIVTANDRSGNFYKQLVIQDDTAGIMLLIDVSNLYNSYPAGRKVYIKCKGLWLGYENGLPVLGYEPNPQNRLNMIPQQRISDFIVQANIGNEVKADTISLVKAKTPDARYFNRLICIREVQFTDTDRTFSLPNSTTNRRIEDCDNNALVVRTSNYAHFANVLLPAGSGTILGIYTAFVSTAGTTPQLLIRDTTDLHFDQMRCKLLPNEMITISDLRNRFIGHSVTLGAFTITGTVISDRNTYNINAQNIVVQQGQRGIAVRFTGTHPFNPGDSLVIDVSGTQLGEFNGLLQVSGSALTVARAARLATERPVAPLILTLGQLTGSDFESYESTLVRIMDATVSGGATFVTPGAGGNSKTLTDPTGTITLYTVSGASFAGQPLPSGSRIWTGIAGQFGNTKQLSVRNPALDIQ